MSIPKSFNLFGHTIRVVFSASKFDEEDGAFGFASYRRNEIQIRPSSEITPLTEDCLEQTFYHELAHFIIYYAEHAYDRNKEPMYKNEGFIDLVGNLMHQAVKSFEYE